VSAAPAGAVVKIFYDGAEVLIGDALRTPTGRIYIIVERRVQARGAHVGRQHLACLVAKKPPKGAMVRRLHWYRRGRKRRTA
jgi:hypothetical protein